MNNNHTEYHDEILTLKHRHTNVLLECRVKPDKTRWGTQHGQQHWSSQAAPRFEGSIPEAVVWQRMSLIHHPLSRASRSDRHGRVEQKKTGMWCACSCKHNSCALLKAKDTFLSLMLKRKRWRVSQPGLLISSPRSLLLWIVALKDPSYTMV